MNKNLFRFVFNAARGQVMAVSEVACSHSGGQGESAGAETRSPGAFASNQPLAPVNITPAAIKSIVSAIALLLAPAWITSAAWARAAPATTVVVNIQTAVGGVSRNSYTQFDVGNPGLILNNSPVNSNTQIGGWVAGNTNLASGSANIILNEVNSTNPTHLRGYIEVAGQKAGVVIANPAGISVNGGGLINASGATLGVEYRTEVADCCC
jgi:filamentous hemagglutinin